MISDQRRAGKSNGNHVGDIEQQQPGAMQSATEPIRSPTPGQCEPLHPKIKDRKHRTEDEQWEKQGQVRSRITLFWRIPGLEEKKDT